MKRSAILLMLVFLSPFFMASTCNKPEKDACVDVACTMMFAMVTVQVQEQDGSPVVLDEVYTVRKSSNETIKPQQQSAEGGHYVVLDDSYVGSLKQSVDSFTFVGMKNGQRVVEEPYVLGADCCHVRRESGKEVIRFN